MNTLKEENPYSKEFNNFTIDDNLYYFLLLFDDRMDFINTKNKHICDLTKEEVLDLFDKAYEYYKEHGIE